MIQCSRGRGSIAAKLPTAAKSFRFTSTTSQVNEEFQFYKAPKAPVPKSATNDGTPGAKTASPRPSLPLSPLMDPKFLAARERYSATKAAPSRTYQTPFQEQLAKNPYARALATPVRMCAVTKEHMPRYFLEDFKLLAHPTTKAPYWMPESLLSRSGGAEAETDSDIELQLEDGEDLPVTEELSNKVEGEVNEAELSEQIAKPTEVLPEHPERQKTPKIGHSSYTLARRDLLHLFQDPAGWYGANPNVFLAPLRMRMQKDGRHVLHQSVWRPDMEHFVLDLMRKDVIQHLRDTVRLKRGYIIGCTGWDDALAKKQVGAYLWTGNEGADPPPLSKHGNPDLSPEAATRDTPDPPPEFATLDTGASSRKIPVLNLRTLLGTQGLDQLGRRGIFGCEVLVLKHRRVTIGLQLKLWKLQGFLAEYRDIPGLDSR